MKMTNIKKKQAPYLMEDLRGLVVDSLDLHLVWRVLPLPLLQRLLQPVEGVLGDGMASRPQELGQLLVGMERGEWGKADKGGGKQRKRRERRGCWSFWTLREEKSNNLRFTLLLTFLSDIQAIRNAFKCTQKMAITCIHIHPLQHPLSASPTHTHLHATSPQTRSPWPSQKW